VESGGGGQRRENFNFWLMKIMANGVSFSIHWQVFPFILTP